MPFSGGGGGQLTNHVHDNTPLQGGPLNFNNTTIAGMAAGDITFSDGVALQTLTYPAVPAGETLTAAPASTAPSWVAAGGGVWEVLADVTLGAPGTLSSGIFSAQDKFIKVLFYGASVASTTLGITCNATGGSVEYATRFERDFTTTGTAAAERSMFYFSGVTTNGFCFVELEGYNGPTAGSDKLFHLNTTANTTTGGTACQSYENYCKYYGGSYVTSFEMCDANPGTTINFQTGSRLLVLATPA